MAENEIRQLQGAICTQYILMKKLFMELEEEREASATAASAALSMILRLQKERAAEKMEASQYKRMAEEKMNHTEETLEVLEQVMQAKELEIYFLRNQLQAYQLKLSSVGIGACDIADETVTRTSSFQEAGTIDCCSVRRNISLPILTDCTNRYSPVEQSAKEPKQHHTDGNSDDESETVESVCADDAINTTEQHVQRGGESSSCSLSKIPQLRGPDAETHCKEATQESEIELKEMAGHSTHDLDEATESGKNCSTDSMTKESEFTRSNRCLNGGFVAKKLESRILWKLSTTRKVGSMNNIRPSDIGVSTPKTVEPTLNRLESEKIGELVDSKRSTEQLILLREVYEQLSMMESHMIPSDSQESPRPDDSSLVSVVEPAALSSFSPR